MPPTRARRVQKTAVVNLVVRLKWRGVNSLRTATEAFRYRILDNGAGFEFSGVRVMGQAGKEMLACEF